MEYRLEDIAGYELEKEKLREIIDMFKKYYEYKEKGVSLSKGLILSGDPGVGKTLFARVLANEIDAPFYYLDGTKMDGILGVYKINRIFKKAYKNTPAVIFIDELNSFIGDYDYESDYTNKNLSALLKLIDGIDKKEGVFVIGATSDKRGLDRAILRSGRMDKHICLASPNLKSRIAIFEHYLKNIDIDINDIDVEYIMKMAEGFTGADIKTLVNEASLEALYYDEPLNNDVLISNIRKIKNQDLDRVAERLDISYYAYHDIAHMIVSRELNGKYDPISIKYDDLSLGNTSIQYLDNDNEDDEDFDNVILSLSNDDILNNVTILLAARALEEIKYNAYYIKCNNDVNIASSLIYNGIDAGLFGLEYSNIYFYSNYFKLSGNNMQIIEDKKNEILNNQYAVALSIIKDNMKYIEILHEILMEKRTLTIAEIEKVMCNK